MTQDYSKKNAVAVLAQVEGYLNLLEAKKKNARYSWERRPNLRIIDVCDNLSIFDWWNETLSISQLKDMRKFLNTACKLGYTGYVCFKVGATGCANGMWAYTEPTTTGYSPNNCKCIYKSFTPAYNYWSALDENRVGIEEKLGIEYDEIKTAKALEKALQEV